MKVIRVKNIYEVDRISDNNNNAWSIILDAINEYIERNEDVLLDFKGIDLFNPWTNMGFKKLFKHENIKIKIYNSEKIASMIDMMCILDGIKTGRVLNENTVVEKPIPKEVIRTEKFANELLGYFVVENNEHILKIYNIVTQLGSNSTISATECAIKKYCKQNNINKVVLATGNIMIQENVIELLAQLIIKLNNNNNISLEVDSDNEKICKSISLYIHKEMNNSYSSMDREKEFRSILKPGTVGMLTKYKRSRAIDSFGRQGKGEVISCRIAIYLGLGKSKEGKTIVKFRSFNEKYLYTKTHWMLEHDNDILERLVEDSVIADIESVGLQDRFLGTQYHFMLPTQKSKDENTTMYDIDENGSVIKNSLTIPERVKAVFDDYDIEYNKESLEQAIKDTRKYLDSIN